MSKAGLVRDLVYIVWPDGYVGYVGSDSEELGDYVRKWVAAAYE
jgi:hypothetical protein